MNSIYMSTALLSETVQTIVISDNNGSDSLMAWGGILLLIFILYMAAMLIYDIQKEARLEKKRKEREEEQDIEFVKDIDI